MEGRKVGREEGRTDLPVLVRVADNLVTDSQRPPVPPRPPKHRMHIFV